MLDLYKLDDNESGIEAFVTKLSAQFWCKKNVLAFYPFEMYIQAVMLKRTNVLFARF